MNIAATGFLLVVAIFLLVLVSYNGIKLLRTTKRYYVYEYENRKYRQMIKTFVNTIMLSMLVMMCFFAFGQKICLNQESLKPYQHCKLDFFDFAIYDQKTITANRAKTLSILWSAYSSMILIPMFTFLIVDQPEDNFTAYGRGNAKRYSIFQYTKTEIDRKNEHRIGKQFLRNEEMILLKEKQKKSSLNANEQLRLKLLIERVNSKDLRIRTKKEQSYYISSKMIRDIAGDME